ncbi:MAG: anti-sigma factor family protein [Candidatus Saccharicenans sp.]|uniref:anti-sigma factor family protein n=1 Tax=Candidatus Saccharicenans sp. TaxID=2819258 RepID=UPI00404AB17B
MNCPDLTEIYAYLEQELSEEDRQRFESHLETCPGCRKLLADRRLYLESLASLPTLEPPPDFTDRVMSGLPPLKSPARLWLGLAGGLYLLFSLVVVGLALGTRTTFFPIFLKIFTNLFNLAADFSDLIIRFIQQAYGLIKALRIFIRVAAGLLSDIFPAGGLGLAALGLGACLTLITLWILLRPGKIFSRSWEHEKY